MIASRPKYLVLHLLKLSVLWMGISVSVAAQSAETSEAAALRPTMPRGADTELQRQISSQPPRRTYFLGEDQNGPKLAGPSVGEPLAITPEPFVAPGTLEVEAPEEPIIELSQATNEISEGSGQPLSDLPDGVGQMVETLPSAPDSDGAAASRENDGDIELAGAPVAGDMDPGDSVSADRGTGDLVAEGQGQEIDATTLTAATGLAYEEAALASFDVSLQAIPNGTPQAEQPLTAFLWDGMTREEAIAALGKLGLSTGSLSLRSFARSIAAGNFSLPPSEDAADIAALLSARLDVFAKIGAASSYVELINSLPRGQDWSGLRKERVHGFLLAGRMADACAEAGNARTQDQDPYWLRVSIVCAALSGNRGQVDFQLDILATLSPPGAVFYAMVDHLTLVAESEAQNVAPPQPEPLRELLPVRVLPVAMARLANMPIKAVSVDGIDPLIVEAALGLPGLAPAARATLMRAAMERGFVSLAVMRAFVESVEAEARNAGTLVDETTAFGVDGVDLAALARLLIVVRSDAPVEERLIALETLWGGATASGLELQLAPLIADRLMDLPPQPLAGAQAAIMARVMLVAGRHDRARLWFDAIRSSPAGADMTRDYALTQLVPLMAGAGSLDIGWLPPQSAGWWDRSSFPTGDPEAAITRRTGLLLTLLETRGTKVPEAHWQALEDRGVTVLGLVPQPASWRRFLRSAHMGKRSDMLAALYHMTSSFGLKSVPAVVAGSVDGMLRQQGMAPLADMLAFELLVAAGL